MKKLWILLAALLLPMLAHATVTGTADSATFTCTGSAGPFPFTFPISTATAMTVTQNGAVLSTSAYTIAPVNASYDNGGSVTLNTACPSAQTLVLERVTPVTQLTQFTPYMPALYANIENGLDKLTEIVQERASTLNIGAPITPPEFSMKPLSTIPASWTLDVTTPGTALANLGGLPLSGGTLTGALNGTSASFSGTVAAGTTVAEIANGIQKADQFTGATASEKMVACLAAAGNGTCDATGLLGVQTMDSTVEVGLGGLTQKLITAPGTTWEPTGASTPATMFNIDHNGSLAGGTHINLPAGFNYTGNAVAITDSISGGTPPVALFGLSDLFCDGYDEAAPTGYCLYMNPPSGGYLQLLDIYNVRSTFMNGLYMGVSGTNAYINGVDFHGLALEDNSNPAHLLVMDSGTSTLGVSNNNFYGVQFEATSGPGITYIGSSPLENNNFYGNMFDMTTEILNSSSGVFKNNNFIGYIGLSNTVVVKQPFTVASAATATPVTVYTLPGSSVATYFVSCSVGVENAGSYYAATSLVTLDGTTANITSLAAGAGMAITLSGLNVQAAQASGGPLPIYCSLMQWK